MFASDHLQHARPTASSPSLELSCKDCCFCRNRGCCSTEDFLLGNFNPYSLEELMRWWSMPFLRISNFNSLNICNRNTGTKLYHTAYLVFPMLSLACACYIKIITPRALALWFTNRCGTNSFRWHQRHYHIPLVDCNMDQDLEFKKITEVPDKSHIKNTTYFEAIFSRMFIWKYFLRTKAAHLSQRCF